MYITKPFIMQAQAASHRQRIFAWGMIVVAVATSVYVFFYTQSYDNFYPKCLFYQFTGLHCPGCGTLRGTNQLLHGNIATAFGLNPLMVLAVPPLLWAFLSQCTIAIRGHSLPRIYTPAWSLWALVTVVIAFWILRNISVYPLTLLAP